MSTTETPTLPSAPAAQPLAAAQGRLLAGRYRLTRLLGQGGMGRVWAAHDDLLEREVAVKEVLLPPGLPDAEREALVVRTLREARAAARVRHPHVVAVYDVVEEDDRPWLVLQLLAPRTLADVLAAEGPLPPAAAARLGLQLLEGLTAVHEAGVVHRDVKPGNVLFGADGGAVLADFGIASLDGEAAVTATGLLLGSPAYLAPERARGAAPSPAADLWALGATLYAAVEGRAPFHRDGPLPTLSAVLTEDVPPAPHAGELAPVLAALLAKDPEARADAATVRALLEQALTPAPALPPSQDADPSAVDAAVPTTTASLVVPAPRAPWRRRALLGAAALAVAVLPVSAFGGRSGSTGGNAEAAVAAPAAHAVVAPAPTRSVAPVTATKASTPQRTRTTTSTRPRTEAASPTRTRDTPAGTDRGHGKDHDEDGGKAKGKGNGKGKGGGGH